MESKFPHWFGHDSKVMSCCERSDRDMMCCDDAMMEAMPSKMYHDTFKDRLMCFLGDEVIVGTDAMICRTSTFCGTICYVGCDYIIVNSCFRRKNVSFHVPIKMIRFIAPYKSRR